jgi:hypothetical protein
MYIKRQRMYTMDERGYIEHAQSVVEDRPQSKREIVDNAQQAELNRINRNREFDSLKRHGEHKLNEFKLAAKHVLNKEGYDAEKEALNKEFDKNEKKIARAEKWQDRKLAAKHTLQDWDASYEDKTGRDLGKDAAIAGGVAAAGVAGYAAYKAWKKKQAKKKAAAAEAEAKFKKED